jgi:hypothetical protein
MIKKPVFAVITTTAYLLVYYLLFNAGVNIGVILMMFSCAPFLVIWTVLSILKDRKYKSRTLGEVEEWGYGDKTFPD